MPIKFNYQFQLQLIAFSELKKPLNERLNIFKQDKKSSYFLLNTPKTKMTWMTENLHGHQLIMKRLHHTRQLSLNLE